MSTAILLGALGGCAAPLPAQQAPLLVAYPGPSKTEAEFQADDATCRTLSSQQAGSVQPNGPKQPARANTAPVGAAAPSIPPDADAAPLAGTPPAPQSTPGTVYLHCMAARSNVVQPVAPEMPVAYSYYDPYPVYLGYGDYYPFLYPGYFGFGYVGRYGGYRGFYGHRGGYGFHNGFGYRGGFGGGGFHNHGGRGGFGRR